MWVSWGGSRMFGSGALDGMAAMSRIGASQQVEYVVRLQPKLFRQYLFRVVTVIEHTGSGIFHKLTRLPSRQFVTLHKNLSEGALHLKLSCMGLGTAPRCQYTPGKHRCNYRMRVSLLASLHRGLYCTHMHAPPRVYVHRGHRHVIQIRS